MIVFRNIVWMALIVKTKFNYILQMKKFIFVFAFILLGLGANAQTTFKSHNFYGNGVTEYIEYYYRDGGGVSVSDEVYYYTSKNAQKIKMNITSATEAVVGMEGMISYQVTFPNEEKVYRLTIAAGGLTCTNPDGSQQFYCIEGFNCED